MPVINGVYTKDFPALGRAPIDTDIIPIAEVANQITYKTTLGEIFNAKVFGTTGRLSKFTSANTLGNSILNEIGNAIHLTNAGTSFASFGIINPGTPGDPGIDNDAYIGSTINNDFTIRVNNTEAARFDTALRFKIANIQNTDTDTDKFLVSDGGVVKYRTGTELRSDIGAGVGSVTSVGLTMPVAFNVANSPIESAGTLAVTAVGTASQYIRGDGQLATLPTGAGGGSAVNYYLNGSVASGVAGYQQMDNTAIIGTGTDFNLTGNGLIAQFLTDAGNPNRLLIPGGAWNLEMFFSVSSSGGNAKFYAEVLEYDGTTFTSIASGITTPEEITGGTSIDLYLTSLGVPETALLITDRLAIRVYIVDNSGGRTVTLHTEDNTLCQVTTTFAGGISALNGLTANTQYFAVGTGGTDFNISSILDTHTFNIPSASATARGVITTGAQTIAGAKTFSVDTIVNGVNIGRGGGNIISNTRVGTSALNANTTGSLNVSIGSNALNSNTTGNSNVAIGYYAGSFTSLAAPNQTSIRSIYLGYDTTASANGNTNEIVIGYASTGLGSNTTVLGNSSTVFGRFWGNLLVGDSSNTGQALQITGNAKITGTITNGTYTYTLPSATGTLALTSDLSAYVTLATTQTITGRKTFNNVNGLTIDDVSGALVPTKIFSSNIQTLNYAVSNTSNNFLGTFVGTVTANRTYSIPNISGTLALTSDITSAISGTTNYIPKFTGANTIGNSGLQTDSSGNLGLGVTPSAWRSGDRALQIGLGSFWSDSQLTANFSQNHYFSSTGRKYIANGRATDYEQYDGYHAWKTAPSGTAGNAITFTQAMTLGANGILSLPSSGSLEIGYTSSPSAYKLDVNGTLRVAGAATFSSSVTATKAILGGVSATSSVANLEVFGSTTASTNNGQIRINDSVTTSKTLSIGVDGANNLGFIQSFQDGVAYRNLILNGLGGNVGIGTTTPSEKLQVNGNLKVLNVSPYIELNSSGWGNSAFIQTNINLLGNAAGDYLAIQNLSGKGIAFQRGTTTDMLISPSNGNVLIGTTDNPGVKLNVNGDIKTSAPSGGTAKPFKVGAAATYGGAATFDRTIEIEIDGTTYYLAAKTTSS